MHIPYSETKIRPTQNRINLNLKSSCCTHSKVGFLRQHPKWSSYRFYAYKKKPPEWLKTGPIFSQVRATKDIQRAYRNKVQRYSDEKESLWEDIKFGLIYGSREFLEYIKETYLIIKQKWGTAAIKSTFKR